MAIERQADATDSDGENEETPADLELRSVAHVGATTAGEQPMVPATFSSWLRLLRVTVFNHVTSELHQFFKLLFLDANDNECNWASRVPHRAAFSVARSAEPDRAELS